MKVTAAIKTRLARRGICTLLLASVASTAWAFNWEPTPKQFALFPEYCKARMSDYIDNRKGRWSVRFPRNTEKIALWKQRIGPDWHHMHHFCKGVAYIAGAWHIGLTGQGKRERQKIFIVAARELGYSFERTSPTYPFWEVFALKYAEALHGAGKRSDAHALLEQIMEERPKNAEAYRLGARLRRREGDLNAGIVYLNEGLKAGAKPNALLFSLANLYYDLGDFAKAREVMERAEAAGVKMDRLKSRLAD